MKTYEKSHFDSKIMILSFRPPKDQLNDKDYEGLERSGPEKGNFMILMIFHNNPDFREKSQISRSSYKNHFLV